MKIKKQKMVPTCSFKRAKRFSYIINESYRDPELKGLRLKGETYPLREQEFLGSAYNQRVLLTFRIDTTDNEQLDVNSYIRGPTGKPIAARLPFNTHHPVPKSLDNNGKEYAVDMPGTYGAVVRVFHT